MLGRYKAYTKSTDAKVHCLNHARLELYAVSFLPKGTSIFVGDTEEQPLANHKTCADVLALQEPKIPDAKL